jgi:hypothetical protein
MPWFGAAFADAATAADYSKTSLASVRANVA